MKKNIKKIIYHFIRIVKIKNFGEKFLKYLKKDII